MPLENRLAGKVAIITGAASGIGEAAVTLFAEQGAKVLANDLSQEKLETCHGSNPDVLCVGRDITEDGAPEALVAAAVEAFGKLDIVFNNAGVCPPEPFMDQTKEVWDHTQAVNVYAANLLAKAAKPHLEKSGQGRIINTASIQSKRAGEALTGYTVSKHGISGLTKQLAFELAGTGITANAIEPGFVTTGISKGYTDLMSEEEKNDFENYWAGKAPVGRLGEPIDIANAALFLARDESEFINGASLAVDGGASAKL